MNKGWEPTPLGDLLTRSERVANINPLKAYKQVTVRLWGHGVILRDEVSGSEISAAKRYEVKPGQFILSKIDARNGAFGLVPPTLDRAVVSGDFPVFDINLNRLEPKYLEWKSKTGEFADLCRVASEGTTNRVRLKEDKFLRLSISLPPLPEQRRILAKIEKLAARIDEAKDLRTLSVAESEALIVSERATIFQKALQKKSVRFDAAATLERGKFSHRPRNDPRFFGGVHPWIQIGEIESSGKYIRHWNQTLNDEGLAISRKFPKGTLLISIAATIGAVGILDFDCCMPDSIVAVTPKPGFNSEFIYHYLSFLRTHLEKIAPQSAQKNINLQILFPLPTPDLPEAEQIRIVTYLDGLQAQVDALKKLQAQTATELDALLPAILDRAFKGEL